MNFLLGCGAGFSGDRTDTAAPIVSEFLRRGLPAALVFETLGERTLADAHRAMREDPKAGFEPLMYEFLEPVLVDCLDNKIPILGNFGAANPLAAIGVIRELAANLRRSDARVGLIQGDDIKDRLHGLDLVAWDTEPEKPPDPSLLISANVYLGAKPLTEALASSADIVVAGRVADPALFLAPLVHHFKWRWNDWNVIAAGMMAGHIGECGAQVTGGYFADPGKKEVPGLDDVGYPVIEVEPDGEFVVTKPRNTGGIVSEQTVKEQLLYEIHDPGNYLTPDVVIDLSHVQVRQVGPDRVRVSGIGGKPAPERLKTTVCFEGGWFGEAEISYAGPNSLARTQLAARTLRERLVRRAPKEIRYRLDIIGYSSVFDDDSGTLQESMSAKPVNGDFRLRLAVEHPELRWVERATQELLALYCVGPAGGGGVRRNIRQRVSSASYLVSRSDVEPSANVFEVTADVSCVE